MTRRNSFFVFCFSLIPGAGEMYLGLMKRGLEVMLLFWGTIAVAGFLHLDFLFFALPIIWFYSFFNTHNLKKRPDDELRDIEAKAFIGFDGLNLFGKGLVGKRHVILGLVFIGVGIYALYEAFIEDYLFYIYQNYPFITDMLRNVPTVIVAVAIICFGIFLLVGKKNKPEQNDEPKLYAGEGTNNGGNADE